MSGHYLHMHMDTSLPERPSTEGFFLGLISTSIDVDVLSRAGP